MANVGETVLHAEAGEGNQVSLTVETVLLTEPCATPVRTILRSICGGVNGASNAVTTFHTSGGHGRLVDVMVRIRFLFLLFVFN